MVLAAFTTAGATIELECTGDLCILQVHGLEVARHDFSDNPIVGDDDHQGFASYGGAGLIITDAEGGGMAPVVTVSPAGQRRTLWMTGQPTARRALVTSGGNTRRPL